MSVLETCCYCGAVLQVQKCIKKIIIWHIFPLPFPIPRKEGKGHFRKPPSLFLPTDCPPYISFLLLLLAGCLIYSVTSIF